MVSVPARRSQVAYATGMRVDENEIVEAERLDARSDLGNLLRAMRASVARIGLETPRGKVGNFENGHIRLQKLGSLPIKMGATPR